MLLLGILLSVVAITALCWLLFTLAVFALPLFVGIAVGSWAYDTGAGWLGAFLVGAFAAAATLAAGQFLIGIVRPVWAKLAIALVFVTPAAVAGYHAVHGIVKHTMPSEAWATIFSIVGAIAVAIAAFLRVAGMAATDPTGRDAVRA